MVHLHAGLQLGGRAARRLTLTHRSSERTSWAVSITSEHDVSSITDDAFNDPALRNDSDRARPRSATERAERHAERARRRLPALDRRQPAERAPRLSARAARRGGGPPGARHFNYYAVSADGRHYLPIGDSVVLASRVQIGNIRPAGDDPTQRAVREEVLPRRRDQHPRLGPLRSQPARSSGLPIGGNSMFAFSEELRAALQRQSRRRAVPRRRQRLGRVVGLRPRRSALRDRSGLRYQTPVGPIRFDVGYQLNPDARICS